MSRAEKIVLTTMCMIYDADGNVLVENRVNPDWPGITFPGGHVEPGESITQSVIREIKEETGLEITSPKICGLKQFPTNDGSRYIVLFYKTDKFQGELRPSDEGDVFWIKGSELSNYNLAGDFDEMYDIFTSDELQEFQWVENGGEWKKYIF